MRRALHNLAFLLRWTLFGLAAAFVVTLLRPELGDRLRHAVGLPPSAAIEPPGATASPAQPTSYAEAVRKAAPSVVSIYTARIVTEQPLIVSNPTVQQFSGITLGQPRRRLERALGSGVIVSPDGYVLTNEHVVREANEIQIVMWDGRVTRAVAVGTDPETDLAVLKIDGRELPAMSLEHTAGPEVGDVVLAIGNPFGLSHTVTQGIVSGVSRDRTDLLPFGQFIQTDAAINEGNSGGALINARGELVGINTTVLMRRVGAEGIGFAIPLDIAQLVLTQIVEQGAVIRGWIGAEYGDAPILPGALAVGQPRGIALTTIYSGGPADQAGLRPGDVLTRFDGSDILDQNDLLERESALNPGSVVAIEGFRSGLPFSGQLRLIQRPSARRR
ncbi:MAG: trypsin-like peptidase domain-containing protein [Xanthomonadales bacterium]|nr:trypsin-like peptidase domain-containing protein [Xanthomonadales bacterium]